MSIPRRRGLHLIQWMPREKETLADWAVLGRDDVSFAVRGGAGDVSYLAVGAAPV